MIWDIQLDKHFASVWTTTQKTLKEYERASKGASNQQQALDVTPTPATGVQNFFPLQFLPPLWN